MYKQYTLITLNEFIEKFKPMSIKWEEELIHNTSYSKYNRINIELKGGIKWRVHGTSFDKFGTTITAMNLKGTPYERYLNFTHIDRDAVHLYHESWFKIFEFLSEEEVML